MSNILANSLARVKLHLLNTNRNMLSLLTSYLTLRTLFFLFCLLNIKNLPLAWELRLIYRGYRSWITKHDVARLLKNASTSSNDTPPDAKSHPLFAPLTISSLTPLLETDHNIHKSNSTYFSDLDESRTALMVRLLSSTKFSPAELESEGFKGRFAIILGSVHASFLKEIKPYESFRVRSRVLGWDEKWILIGSVFVRMESDAEKRKRVKQEGQDGDGKKREVLLASCLSKYVVKKGRYTVPPERCWRSAGWLPDRPGNGQPGMKLDSSAVPTPDVETESGEVKLTEADLRRRVQETAAKAAERLNAQSSEHERKSFDKRTAVQEHIRKQNEECWRQAEKWSWDEVEAERARGMKIAGTWLGLDKQLKGLWEDDTQRLAAT